MEKSAKQAIEKAYKKGIFIFRRDHRLDDNTGLLWILKNAVTVYPVFIFDERQINPARNPYYGSNCVQFMCESLTDLNEQLKTKGSFLSCFRGEYPWILEKLIDSIQPEVLCLNRDYTPYALERDSIIEETCKRLGVEYKPFEDITLLTVEQAKGCFVETDKQYKKFSPFHVRALEHPIRFPVKCAESNFNTQPVDLGPGTNISDFGREFYTHNPDLLVKGGRQSVLQQLADLPRMKDYRKLGDDLQQTTSLLGAHNKFGTISMRELFHRSREVLGDHAADFVRQLYCRDYFYFIGLFFPEGYSGPQDRAFAQIPWEDDPIKIDAWQKGLTGSPLVDAAMRQLNKTGWLSNRCRLIVSNYLIKDLHVNWQHGERYFASQLTDYDRAMNNGGWQWSAGCGYSTQPYFRIYDPKVHIEKFDPYGTYIKKWIPELEKVPMKSIINWESDWTMYPETKYPGPVVRHEVAKKRIMEMYQISLNTKPQKKQTKGNYGEKDNRPQTKYEPKQDNRVKITAPKYDDEDDEPLYVPKNSAKAEPLDKRPSTSAYPKEPAIGEPDEKYRKSYSNAKNEKISWKQKPQPSKD